MEVLWLAIFIYSLGLGAVLHFKPELMFTKAGNWKEFGYQRGERYTIFPVWLFAIVWALVSYVLATSTIWCWPVLGVVSTTNWVEVGEEEDENENASNEVKRDREMKREMKRVEREMERVEMERGKMEESEREMGEVVEVEREEVERERKSDRKTLRSTKTKAKQGYYVLDNNSNSSTGLRKYIYYGPAPPPDVDMDEVHREE